MAHLPEPPTLNLKDPNGFSQSVATTGVRALNVNINPGSWGAAVAELKWSATDDEYADWESFNPSITFSSGIPSRVGLSISGVPFTRLETRTSDSAASPDAKIFITSAAEVFTVPFDQSVAVDLPATRFDAFQRLRVSNPETIFDSKQIFDNAPLFWDDAQVSGGSTTTSHSVNTASSTIGVGNAAAGVRLRQTFMRFNYQPGKSQQIIMTGVLDKSGGGTGIVRDIGLADDNNGVFFQDDGGTINVVVRSKTSGSVVDTKVAQSDWNHDKMDGSGPSGITLDFSKSQIYMIDFEWLSVGTVSFSFFVDGGLHACHHVHNANSLTVAYMSTPNLPLRYRIENDGNGVASTLEHICSTVISEGGSTDLGVLRYKSTAGTHVDANVENTVYAIVGIRLKAANLGATIKIVSISLVEHQGAKEYEWFLVFNPTVAGTFTYSDETNSSVQTATGALANTVTGGTIIPGGMASSAQKGGVAESKSIDSARRLGADISGTVDTIVLCVRPIGGSANIDIEGSIGWRELS